MVWLFAVLLQWNRDGGWTMYRSQLVNLPVLYNMQLDVSNDLAKAKRRWTEKSFTSVQMAQTPREALEVQIIQSLMSESASIRRA